MKGALAIRKPIGNVWISVASNNVNTGSWLVVSSSLPQNASGILYAETSGHLWKVSTGTPGNEAASLLPFYLMPNGQNVIIPIQLLKGLPLTISPLDANATTGLVAFVLFG
jgi:hypothetical protein